MDATGVTLSATTCYGDEVMKCGRPVRLVLGVSVLVLMLAAGPVMAGPRVVVGVGGYPFGYPYYPYPYPYPYAYPYPPYPYVGPYSVPPPGWVAGHWEWRENPSGQSLRVWVPPYLE